MQPLDLPPVPVLATLSLATSLLTTTFDRPLQPGFSAGANWAGVGLFGVGRRIMGLPGNLTIAGSTVSIAVAPGLIPQPPPEVVDYLAAPPDVLSLTGVPAAAFANFPLTSIP